MILMDVNMPQLNGYEAVERIKKDERHKETPVIFVSAIEETNVKMKAFLAGGVDYVTRPYQFKELLARITTHLKIYARTDRQRRQIAELQEVNQLKDDLLSVVAHDLQNPISVIVTYVDLLKRRDRDYLIENPQSRETLDNIKDTAMRMARFVGDLLDVIRIESQENVSVQNVALNELLHQCYEDGVLLGDHKNIKMEHVPLGTPVTMRLPSQLFSQAIINLLSNAVKYSYDQSSIHLIAERDDNEVRVIVQDTGLGIPAEAIPNLFKRFYRVDTADHQARSGNGLGLAIVKLAIELSGGTISVTSELGKGSKFVVHLPSSLIVTKVD
jgi:signal transduction histidine kinase